MLIIFKSVFIIGLFLFILGCSMGRGGSTPQQSPAATSTVAASSLGRLSPIYNDWRGTPYLIDGTTKAGIDCSAFTQYSFKTGFGISLPRTTALQAKVGRKISLAQAQKGDLVFFKTGFRTRHVGIYLGNNEFMHASTSRGVIISSLDNPYWNKAFWQVRRVVV